MASGKVRSAVRTASGHLKDRARMGFSRVRGGFGQSLQITAAAVGAYFIAETVLGHTGPLFAATAAIVSLGYGNGSAHLRRILEVSIGCTLGIVVGDVLMYFLGRGIGQAALVLLFSILLARFLDNGTIFTTQMGLQSVLIVLLPPSVDGPFARSLDAVVGGLCALLIMALVPNDPRREPVRDLHRLTGEFSTVLREAAKAIGDYDAAEAWHALSRARQTHPLVTSLEGSLRMGRENARLTLTRRATRGDIERYGRTLEGLDNAIRNTRVLTRRIANTIDTVQLRPGAVKALSRALGELADAVDLIGLSLTAETAESRRAFRERARQELSRTADGLDPQAMDVRTYQGEALVMLIRPLTVDLLVATGMKSAEASRTLATIRQELTEAMGTIDPDEDPREDRL
ncbi:FUSC family protein [Rothia halotolerans]|uniref:FUSC family protein n=1 Tax=Rothia halotolerans TaxID=405770 RepID=UPI00101DC7D4|nr:FUSC family protein [Rothia halotolerans]